MKLRTHSVLLVAFVVVYFASYAALRLANTFTHFSNADLWHPEKRSPEHYVSAGHDDLVLLEAAYWPLRSGEALAHRLLN